jgi:creatinine amidohydrolase
MQDKNVAAGQSESDAACALNDWELLTTNQHNIAKNQYEVAVLPIGATEAHNRHLPEGMDWLHTTAVAREACRCAWEKYPRVILLPGIPYGVDCNLMAFPLSIHVSQATLDAMVRDIIISLHRHGIKKVVLVNGHGGNDFVPLIRQIQSDMDTFVFLCDWWKVGEDKYDDIFENPDDHAGELETSVAMALCPELVKPENAGNGKVKPFRFEALRNGWVRTSRDFAKINDHCAAGDPSKASPDKGRQYLDLVVSRLSDFLVDLAQTPVDENFPHADLQI